MTLSAAAGRQVDARDEKIAQLEKALGATALRLEIAREVIGVYERKAGPLPEGRSKL